MYEPFNGWIDRDWLEDLYFQLKHRQDPMFVMNQTRTMFSGPSDVFQIEIRIIGSIMAEKTVKPWNDQDLQSYLSH